MRNPFGVPTRFLYNLGVFLVVFSLTVYICSFGDSTVMSTRLMPTIHKNVYEHQLLPSHNWVLRPSTEKCQPVKNIGFLKNHKCASSSIQNILFRYGLNHGLHFALPSTYLFFGNLYEPFKADMVRETPWFKLGVNIFAIHTKWNHQEIMAVMPKDTVYITIVRDPAEVFESFYIFMRFDKKYEQTVSEFVASHKVDEKRRAIGYNQMTWDFGITPSEINNLTAVQELVDKADREFNLVMLVERMEESLVLMSHLLCWDLTDVMVLKINARFQELKTQMNDEAWALLRKRLASDYLLYDHFTQRFDKLVEAYGRERMEDDVRRLREATAKVLKECDFIERPPRELLGQQNQPLAPGIIGYDSKVSNSTCDQLSITELNFIDILRERQKKEVAMKFGNQTNQ